MMKEEILGINVSNMNAVIQLIQDDLNSLLKRYDLLNQLVKSLDGSFETPSGDTLKKSYYSYLSQNYEIVQNNISNDIRDLENVKLNYRKTELFEAARIDGYSVNKATNKIEGGTK